MISARKGIMLDKLLEIAAFEELSEQCEAFLSDAAEAEHPVSQSTDKHLHRAFRRQRGESRREKRNRNRAYRALRTAVMAVAVAASVSFGGVMTVEAVRTEVYKVVVDVSEKFFSVFIRGEEDAAGEYDPSEHSGLYDPTYVPVGYAFAGEVDAGTYVRITYRSDTGFPLHILQASLTQGNDFDVDGEKHDLGSIAAGQYTGILFRTPDNDLLLHAVVRNETHSFHIFGQVSEADMERIIEGLTPRQP